MAIFKYSGAGNTFAVIDGRNYDLDSLEGEDAIKLVCTEISTDGLMILHASKEYDFEMEYFNSDGSGGMMCGNGGRCIASFAHLLRIEPANGSYYVFKAADGVHTAQILSSEGRRDIVRLGMIDVHDIKYYPELKVAPVDGYFLNTGTRHFVIFDEDVEEIAVTAAGEVVRYAEEFAPEGANVNFVAPYGDGIKVRTYEKGVEGETDACGTGITASAIAAYYSGIVKPSSEENGHVKYSVRARFEDLSVEFHPIKDGEGIADEVYLTGPAELIYFI